MEWKLKYGLKSTPFPIRHNLVTFMNVINCLNYGCFNFSNGITQTLLISVISIVNIYVKIYHLISTDFIWTVSGSSKFVSTDVHLISVWGMLSSSFLKHG